jgi:ATP-dependent RNA helicase RhlE
VVARWLREEAMGPVLVFCRTKIGAERLAQRLSGMGIRAASLHADRTQQQRMALSKGSGPALTRSSSRPTWPLAALTSTASLTSSTTRCRIRPSVRASCRAHGRAESTGSALTLVAPEELRALRALEKAVGVQLQ